MAFRLFVGAVDTNTDISHPIIFDKDVDNTGKSVPSCFLSISGGGNNIDDGSANTKICGNNIADVLCY